jgi:signal transduction histidine kinase
LGWLHISSDLATWAAYTAIPLVLGYFVLRRHDVVFPGVFWIFGVFILACGLGHLVEAAIFWWPAYGLAGGVKLLTAVVSWVAVVALVKITPAALALPGLSQLNQALEKEVQERKQAGEQTRLANQQLAQANQELSRQREELEDLVSIVAHDLKRPVLALDGLLHLVRDTPAGNSGQTEGLLSKTSLECERMKRLLEDVSSVSAAARREVAVEQVDLRPWFEDLTAPFLQKAAARGVGVNCVCEDGRVKVARAAAEETCTNLLENALNYGCSNPDPRIEICCRLTQDALEISVSDNGMGIDPRNHRKVFEPFRRLAPEMAAGSGIGLVSARRLVNRHGGTISLQSDVGQGATFLVRLPFEPDQPDASGSTARNAALSPETAGITQV